MQLVHKDLPWVRQNLPYKGIVDIDDLIGRIKQAAPKSWGHLANPSDKDKEDTENVFKGAAFEVFGEYFSNKFETSTRIYNYQPAQEKGIEDYGVDGFGQGQDKTPGTTQFKFRSNPETLITYEEIAKFRDQSMGDYGVVNPENMIVIHTSFGFNQHAEKNRRKMRDFGIDQLRAQIASNNKEFWDGFVKAIETSQVSKRRQHKQRYKHQDFMNKKIRAFLDNGEARGWVGCGTGGGKTLVISDTIKYYLSQEGAQLVIVSAPRIQLCEQIKQDIWSDKTIDFERFTFHSGGKEELEFYEGDETQDQRSTTSLEKILEWNEQNKNKDRIIFTTPHSSPKLLKALNSKGVTDILYISDECHNLVQHQFASILDKSNVTFTKFIGFTATAQDTPDANGKGMNNCIRWGRCIAEVSPVVLASDGVTVPPRAYIMDVKDIAKADDLEIDIVRQVVRHFKDEVCPGTECRIIVTCTSVDKAHDMADGTVLDKVLPEFERYVITSDLSRMSKRKRKAQIDKFSKATNALMFHFDILGEGIDVPGVTAVLPLRALSRIKAIQNVGRASRIVFEDRDALAEGKISVMNRGGWKKPYAWILCPIVEGDNESVYTYQNTLFILHELRRQDYNFHVDQYVYVADSKPPKSEPEIVPYMKKEDPIDQLVKDAMFRLEGQDEADRMIARVAQDLEVLQQQDKEHQVATKKNSAREIAIADVVLTEEDLSQLAPVPENDF